jgi:hypothetical protein
VHYKKPIWPNPDDGFPGTAREMAAPALLEARVQQHCAAARAARLAGEPMPRWGSPGGGRPGSSASESSVASAPSLAPLPSSPLGGGDLFGDEASLRGDSRDGASRSSSREGEGGRGRSPPAAATPPPPPPPLGPRTVWAWRPRLRWRTLPAGQLDRATGGPTLYDLQSACDALCDAASGSPWTQKILASVADEHQRHTLAGNRLLTTNRPWGDRKATAFTVATDEVLRDVLQDVFGVAKGETGDLDVGGSAAAGREVWERPL